jgi:hypothetical protein
MLHSKKLSVPSRARSTTDVQNLRFVLSHQLLHLVFNFSRIEPIQKEEPYLMIILEPLVTVEVNTCVPIETFTTNFLISIPFG